MGDGVQGGDRWQWQARRIDSVVECGHEVERKIRNGDATLPLLSVSLSVWQSVWESNSSLAGRQQQPARLLFHFLAGSTHRRPSSSHTQRRGASGVTRLRSSMLSLQRGGVSVSTHSATDIHRARCSVTS